MKILSLNHTVKSRNSQEIYLVVKLLQADPVILPTHSTLSGARMRGSGDLVTGSRNSSYKTRFRFIFNPGFAKFMIRLTFKFDLD